MTTTAWFLTRKNYTTNESHLTRFDGDGKSTTEREATDDLLNTIELGARASRLIKLAR